MVAPVSRTRTCRKFPDMARDYVIRRKLTVSVLTSSARQLKKETIRGLEDARDDAEDALRKKGKQLKKYADESLPTDVKDAFIERFKAIVNEIQSDPQYSEAVDTLVSLVRKYATKSVDAITDAAESTSAKVEANQEAESAVHLLREIVESFTGPLDNVFKTGDKVVQDLKNDDRIQRIIDEADKLLDRAINDPGYLTSSKCQRRVEALYDEGQELVSSNQDWKRDMDALASELDKCLQKAQNDKALAQLGDRVERFARATAKFGRTGFNLIDGGGIWSDLTQVLVPRLLGALHAIPLPRVEFTVSCSRWIECGSETDLPAPSPFSPRTLTLSSTTSASRASRSFRTRLTSATRTRSAARRVTPLMQPSLKRPRLCPSLVCAFKPRTLATTSTRRRAGSVSRITDCSILTLATLDLTLMMDSTSLSRLRTPRTKIVKLSSS